MIETDHSSALLWGAASAASVDMFVETASWSGSQLTKGYPSTLYDPPIADYAKGI